jgi:hypothetical protein
MIYPDCEIIECEQRTPEWFEARKGVLTASNFGAWLLTEKTQGARDAREKAICKLIAGVADAWEPSVFENDAMRRGTELEPEAVASFEKATNLTVSQVGFCRSLHGRFGCSPDGLIHSAGAGLEGKVPIPSTHILYRRAGQLPDEYKYQVHGSMAVTGSKEWWFQSYNPGLSNLRILVKRDTFTEELFAALKRFSIQAEAALLEESEAWRKEFEV